MSTPDGKLSQQQLRALQAVFGPELAKTILAGFTLAGERIGEQLRERFPAARKSGAVNFFGQSGQKQSSATQSPAEKFFKPTKPTPGASAFFNADNPRLVQLAEKQNHIARQKLAREVDKLFKGE